MIRLGNFKTTDEQRKIINDILDSGMLTEGKYVKKLEREMEKFLDVKHAILVSNGTVALQLVSQYLFNTCGKLNIVVPAMTFPATINAFLVTGHNVQLCDIGEDLQIDVDTIENKEDVDVVVPVHLLGYTCNMEKIIKESLKYNWILIEDTCEAFGAEYGHAYNKAGTLGDFGCYSFYVSHNLSSGELGMVVTDNDEQARVLRSMKNHGRTGNNLEFEHTYIGSNYKTTEFTAGMCYGHRKDTTSILKTRLENARYYFDNMDNSNLEQFHCPDNFSPLAYPIEAKSEEYRKYICKKLNDNGIETRYIFPCLKNQTAYGNKYKDKSYPVAERLEKTVFYIGIHHLLTKEDMDKVIKIINEG